MARLRQNTAVSVMAGPFLDKSDGVSEEADLTISDVQLSKNNGAFASRHASGTISYSSAGWYLVPLDATDTATLGRLVLRVQDATAFLPVWHEFEVEPANYFDQQSQGDKIALIGSTGATIPAPDKPGELTFSVGKTYSVATSTAKTISSDSPVDYSGGAATVEFGGHSLSAVISGGVGAWLFAVEVSGAASTAIGAGKWSYELVVTKGGNVMPPVATGTIELTSDL